eukprot:1638824-Alexandrium_andersonii.AAC.1
MHRVVHVRPRPEAETESPTAGVLANGPPVQEYTAPPKVLAAAQPRCMAPVTVLWGDAAAT